MGQQQYHFGRPGLITRLTTTGTGLGLAISSFGVTICPPIFGLAAERLGGFGVPWAGLGLVMAATLCLLIPVREGRMETS